MYKRRPCGWAERIDFVLIDLICLHFSFLIANLISDGSTSLPYGSREFQMLSLVMTLVDASIALLFGTFSRALERGIYEEFAATVKHVISVFAVIAYYMFFLQAGDAYSRVVLTMTMVFHAVTGYGARMLYKNRFKNSRNPSCSLLIITTEADVKKVVNDLGNAHNLYRIAGLALLGNDLTGKSVMNVPVVASSNTVIDYVSSEWIDEALVNLPPEYPGAKELIKKLIRMGVVVHISVVRLFELPTRGQIVQKVGRSVVVTSSLNFASPLQFFIKRMVDIIGGIVGCVLAVVICLLITPFLLKESPGPLFFVQERVGVHGKRFKMYKIRSMYLDAEARKQELLAANRVNGGLMFKLDWDPRIIGNRILPDGTRKTGIGQFIRKTSLDEFPQFLNVLKGDMSLVGTRPPTVDEWKKYQLHHHARLALKPGITGMWQVSGRSEITDFEEVVKMDMEFIDNWSMGLEFRILFKTAKALLVQDGAM